MAETSHYWGGNTIGDAVDVADDMWSDIWSKMLLSDSDDGFVIPLKDDELAVAETSPASMDVTVASGSAFIKGRIYENTTDNDLTVAANASGNPRIDRIILRTDIAAQTIRLAVLQGTPGAAPALPALTQTAATYEVSLAYVWVANGAASIVNTEIHDERLFLETAHSRKYSHSSTNLISNSEFMGFSALSGGATTNPPDLWDLVSTPANIASATRPSQMVRGRATQITANGNSEGISQTISIKPNTPCSLKALVNVTAGDVGKIQLTFSADTIAEYPATNQDVGVPLRGPSGAGSTITITASGSSSAIGNAGGVHYAGAQGIQVTGGRLTQFTVTLVASDGSPTGTATWEIRTDNAGLPSATILQTGTWTPTASSTNTVNVSDGVILADGVIYHLVLRSTNAQSANVAWRWQNALVASTYAPASGSTAPSPYTSWTALSSARDRQCSLTTVAVSVGDKLSQGFLLDDNADIATVGLYIKKVGSPVGTMTLRVETDTGGMPSGTLVDIAATTTLGEAGLNTNYTSTAFTFATPFTCPGGQPCHLVLSTDRATSIVNYVLWGADASSPSYIYGAMASQVSPTWSAEGKDACFIISPLALPPISRIIRRTGAWIEETIYIQSAWYKTVVLSLTAENNGDIVKFGQSLFQKGRIPGPFREVPETVLFGYSISDANWTADAKADSTTTIDLDADFGALILPGTKSVLLNLKAKDTAAGALISQFGGRAKSGTYNLVQLYFPPLNANLDYYQQGWVPLNIDNQFDLYVVDTTASSIVCTATILGIDI